MQVELFTFFKDLGFNDLHLNYICYIQAKQDNEMYIQSDKRIRDEFVIYILHILSLCGKKDNLKVIYLTMSRPYETYIIK